MSDVNVESLRDSPAGAGEFFCAEVQGRQSLPCHGENCEVIRQKTLLRDNFSAFGTKMEFEENRHNDTKFYFTTVALYGIMYVIMQNKDSER